MRLGVLDVGSNTVHLLVVDAHRGAQPLPQMSRKSPLRLAERIDACGNLAPPDADALVAAVRTAREQADELRCDEMLAFATSAVRDARNAAEVLERVRAEAGVDLEVLTGEDEARLTFLAVRRWYGWSAGRLLCLDIGGGSLELACGSDEDPTIAASIPLGAGRLARERLGAVAVSPQRPAAAGKPFDPADVEALREYVRHQLRDPARLLLTAGVPDRAVATSKTFRSLARLAGAAPSAAGPRARRALTVVGLNQVTRFIEWIDPAHLSQLPGVSPDRAHQLLAGAVVAQAAMELLDVQELEICPWALREGVILQRLDWLHAGEPASR
ncbi:MAG: Ppx/GppA family phosphatase [Frankiaceae bacterium]|jgi:exopolyphosphatase/guanosine-5'-triphosphate,3'-diphosphate pyrophosphatase|nr:Ppx/GppA family phosphatase [Frankiaceae bacterium]